jgi:hypothetical protein
LNFKLNFKFLKNFKFFFRPAPAGELRTSHTFACHDSAPTPRYQHFSMLALSHSFTRPRPDAL